MSNKVERTVREKLGNKEGKRESFYGKFERVGRKRGKQSGLTFLLVDVRSKGGQVVTDHLWFNLTEGFKKLGHVEPGELIQFDARVVTYEKGYIGNRPDKVDESKLGLSEDFKLSHPTNFRRFLGEEGQRVSTSNAKHKKLGKKASAAVGRRDGPGYEVFEHRVSGTFGTLENKLKALKKDEPRLLIKEKLEVRELLSYKTTIEQTLRIEKDKVYQDRKKYGAKADTVVCIVIPDKLKTVKGKKVKSIAKTTKCEFVFVGWY